MSARCRFTPGSPRFASDADDVVRRPASVAPSRLARGLRRTRSPGRHGQGLSARPANRIQPRVKRRMGAFVLVALSRSENPGSPGPRRPSPPSRSPRFASDADDVVRRPASVAPSRPARGASPSAPAGTHGQGLSARPANRIQPRVKRRMGALVLVALSRSENPGSPGPRRPSRIETGRAGPDRIETGPRRPSRRTRPAKALPPNPAREGPLAEPGPRRASRRAAVSRRSCRPPAPRRAP